jgi:hypothetical protein
VPKGMVEVDRHLARALFRVLPLNRQQQKGTTL